MLCKLKGAGHSTSAKRMTSILRHVAEAFPPARQAAILNSHRVIDGSLGFATNCYQYLNGAKLRLLSSQQHSQMTQHSLLGVG